MPGVMQAINKAMGPTELALAIGGSIADPALIPAMAPLAFQGMQSTMGPGGVAGPSATPNMPNLPQQRDYSPAPSMGSFASAFPTSSNTGPSTFPAPTGQQQQNPNDLINQAIASVNPAASPNPFAPWSVAA